MKLYLIFKSICDKIFGPAGAFIILLYLLMAPIRVLGYCECPWSALIYYGKMTNDDLGQVLTGNFTLADDTLYSFELGRRLSCTNPLQIYLQPIVNSVDVLANFTLLDDAVYGTLSEFNAYLAFRWQYFPWNQIILTTMALGEGVSYVSRIPSTEEVNSDESKHLLNFLLFEITFASPRCPQWELVARIHHRSGMFGFYHATNSGSTAVGLGLRYRF